MDRGDPPGPLPDRENLRNLETILRLSPHVMARPRQGPPADPSYRHRLNLPRWRHRNVQRQPARNLEHR
jgi:hypothetical protein